MRTGNRTRTTLLTPVALATVALTGLAVLGAAPAPAHIRGPAPDPADRPGSGRVVVEWNQALLKIQRTPGAQPATIHPTRAFAITQAAIYDAVVATSGHGTPYLFSVPSPRGASALAAAAQAGHDSLLAQYPAFAGMLDDQLSAELAGVPNGRAKQDGVRVGALVAKLLLAARSDDGSDRTATPPAPGPDLPPGAYRPTPPGFAPPAFTTWSRVRPFLADSARQFRPGPPPALTGPAYARALNEVRRLGQDTSSARSADRTEIARFWSAPIWNYWNEIAQDLAIRHDAGLFQTARVFAQLDLALADGVISFYDAKYHYALWRPVTAIRLADTDGNPATRADPTWSPLAGTPADPSYPGAHSVISATAAGVLAASFGDRQYLVVHSEVLPGVSRSFDRLSAVVTEAGLSRIYAGVHTRVDHEAGVRLGERLSAFVVRHGPR